MWTMQLSNCKGLLSLVNECSVAQRLAATTAKELGKLLEENKNSKSFMLQNHQNLKKLLDL